MSGYYKQSMSMNALSAYDSGMRPRSKWDKYHLIKSLSAIYNDEEMQEFKKYSTEVLRRVFLHYSEWHHTGKHYKETYFYELIDSFKSDYALELCEEEKRELKAEREEQKANKQKCYQKAFCHYLTWEGTRNHPKAIDHEGYCYIGRDEKWAFFDGFKKSTSANGFYIIECFNKAPYGTSAEFKKIEKYWK